MMFAGPIPLPLRAPAARAWLLLALLAASLPAPAQTGSAFSFQGRLHDSGMPAAGTVSLRITPWDAEADGTALAAPLETGPLALVDGVFSTVLDFGPAVFLGTPVWLAIEADVGAGYVLLEPRQPVTPTPYAMHAATVAVDAVDGLALQDGAVDATKIAPGAVGATQVDASQVQRRIAPDCAAGTAIGAVAEDGTTTCVPTAGDDGDWFNGEFANTTNKRVAIGSFGYTGAQLYVVRDSTIAQPQLELRENGLDYARLSFSNGGPVTGEDPHFASWSIAAQTRPASAGGPASDQVNFFNSRSGDVMTLYGNGWMGLGPAAFTPDAPLMVTSNGFYAPGIGPYGRGDLYVGNGSLGLSLGVATGGGGAGAGRIWTDGGAVDQLFLGSANHGDVLAIKDDLVGIGTTNPTAALDVDGSARVRTLSDPAALFRRPVYALADGTLVADAATSHTLQVDAVALSPDSAGAAFTKNGFDFSGAYGTSGAFSLWAPVELPSDAVITSFSCVVRDNTSGPLANLRCELGGRSAFAAGGPNYIINASVESSITSSGFQTLTDTSINGPNVDTGQYAYFVRVYCGDWQGSSTAVLGLRISYTR